MDFVELFLQDDQQINPDDLNDVYVLVNFRPVVTKKNWRMDCGVAGYDNTFGLPPFFPTRLRFEDYIYRLWIQQEGIAAAHVDAAQNHTKSNYMRNPPSAEILNEELANLLKRKIRPTVSRLDELSIAFDYEGEVTAQDAEQILDKIVALHARALKAAAATASPQRADVAARVCRQPAQGVLWFRARLLSAELAADRGRCRQRHQGLDRVVADAGGDLLLPEGPLGFAAGAGQQPEEARAMMRIAQIAPLYESVPPKAYGGTERVVSYLTEELVRLGHEVTLFASGDSETTAKLVAACPRALWRNKDCRETLPHHVRLMELVFQDVSRFDILHFHCDYLHFPLLRRHPHPSVTTLHGQIHRPDLGPLFAEYPDVPLVSISDNQRQPIPEANWQATVYHGLPRDLFTYRGQPGGYLALAGPHVAREGRRSGHRNRSARQDEIEDRRQNLPRGTRLLSRPHRTLAASIPGVGRVHRRGGRPGEGRIPRQRPGLALPHRLAGAVRLGDDRGHGLRHASHCLAERVRTRGAHGRRNGLHRRHHRRGDAGSRDASLSLDRRACRRSFEETFDAARMARDYVEVYRRLVQYGSEGRSLRHATRSRDGLQGNVLRPRPR